MSSRVPAGMGDDAPPPELAPPGNGGGAARRGALWAFANNGSRQLIGFLAFLGLARMLTPEDFGVVALGTVFVLLGNLLMEQGLGDALVQHQAPQRLHLDTLFWTCLGVGGALLGLIWYTAPWLARTLGQPQLEFLLPALAVQYPLNALALVPQAILQRRMDFRPLAIRGTVGLGIGCALGLGCAACGLGAWSLVAQQVGGSAAGAAILWASTDWRPRRRYSMAHLADLHRFGRKLVGVGLLDLFNRKFDDFLIGSVLGATALGFYNVAYQALLVIEQVVSKGFDALALAALSRLQHDRAALAAAVQTTARYAAALAVPVFVLAMLFAEPLIALAFGERWLPAAGVLRILALVGALHTVFQFNHALFKAVGRPDISLRLGAIAAGVNLVGFLIAVRWGIEAVAWAYVLRGYALAPLTLLRVRGLTGLSVRAYLGNLVPALAGGAAMCALVLALREVWPGAQSLVGLATCAVFALGAHLLLLEALAPDLRRGVFARGAGAGAHRDAKGGATAGAA